MPLNGSSLLNIQNIPTPLIWVGDSGNVVGITTEDNQFIRTEDDNNILPDAQPQP